MAKHQTRPINTTPDLSRPRLTTAGEDRLPGATRLEIIAALMLSTWGLVMVAIAIFHALAFAGA